MITINKEYSITQTINKSIFICTLFPISSNEDALNTLTEVRKKYYDATHNCYAYIYGETGEYARCSDDGEPSQTAGVVILEVLKKNELTNILAVVTRYFGGIKLGAPGLVRAYSSSTALAVKDIVPMKLIKCVTCVITIDYTFFNYISKIFEGYQELSKVFNDKITLEYVLPLFEEERIKQRAIEITKGQVIITFKDERMLAL